MDIQIKTGALNKSRTDCLVVSIFADKSLSNGAKVADTLTEGGITQLIKLGDIETKAGSLAWVVTPVGTGIKRLLVVCLNSKGKTVTDADITSSATSAAKALIQKKIKQATWAITPVNAIDDKTAATLIAQAFTTETYYYSATKSKDLKPPALTKLTLQAEKKASTAWKKGADAGIALGKGINFCRELGNLPGNVCTPTYLANEAKTLARGQAKLTTKIIDEPAMRKMGMGSLLSVAAGSEEPPKLIAMEYKGGKPSAAPIVLVGKGITFDTGGISLKPGAAMDEMKFDMCGAASVFGVMKAITLLQPAMNVIGVVAAAENMPSGKATKPGDVVTSMSGQTIEVLNTDAEGRLVLCDALTYVERYKPKAVVDIATLTGACVIALGSHATGLYANNQDLANSLLQAGEQAQDKAWQMPLWDEYQKQLNSNFADMANIGGREAGSVTAACFLSRYTKAYKWAHLDIAGSAWRSGAAKGATGRPVGLLMQYIAAVYG